MLREVPVRVNDRKEVAKKIEEADAVLIGASNGLSITEGLHLFADNPAFEELFGDLKKKYGITCILQGMGARWPSEEEKWGFWSRLVHHYCGKYRETQVMADLAEKMAAEEKAGKIPSALVSRCPVCGGPMQVHMEMDHHFIPDTDGRKHLEDFLEQYHGKKLVILELGIGWGNRLIKAPLMRLTAKEPLAFYVTVNLGEIFIPDEIRKKSRGLDGDLAEILHELAEARRE